MDRFSLVSHPDHPAAEHFSVSVEMDRLARGEIDLVFRCNGTMPEGPWDDVQAQAFADGLWKHTCFEAFIGGFGEDSYVELNFAPSMLWAAYSFDRYREGMIPLRDSDPTTGAGWSPNNAWLGVSLRLPMLADLPIWQMNFAAIIEAKDGTKSYWALAHAPGAPDFHNRDCFIATLPAPRAP